MSRQRESYPLSSDSAEKLKSRWVCLVWNAADFAKGRPMYEGVFADSTRGPELW